MSKLLSRAHQWRLIWSLSTRFSSGISDSKTLIRMAFDAREKREKERTEKHEMVKKLARDVEILTCRSNAGAGVCDVYLVGTNHLSLKSSKEVGEIIRFLKPEVVFLELCSSRQNVLTTKTVQMPTDEEIFSELVKSKPNIKALLWKYYYAKIYMKLGYLPGSEFRVAYEEAIKYGGRIVLGDRPAKITRQRVWRKMPLWEKIKFVFTHLGFSNSHSLEDMFERIINSENEDIIEVQTRIQKMRKKFPTLMEILVHERDQYMCVHLAINASKCSSVLAVVGKGHLQGMKKYWMQPIELKDLVAIPPPKAIISRVSLAYLLAGVSTISSIIIYLSFKT